MSNAHRPTWNPAVGRESKGGSRQYSNKDMAGHTKLKFRQPGQTSTFEVSSSDLKRDLLIAERKAVDKKRKAQGLGPLPALLLDGAVATSGGEEAEEDGAGGKRRKLLEGVVGLDRDDEDEDDQEGAAKSDDEANGKGKGKAKDDGSDSDSDEESDSDDEDDTAELLRELEKIKRERAEEKARLDAIAAASQQTDREAEIATGNPLLNLAAALGQSTPGGSSDAGSFKVGRRWDDDLIFKNQAAGTEDKNKKKEFVNDLLRSEFHRKFMGKFIK